MNKGNFTLPGQAGYEALTLELAKRWGADVIRDSDGTKLSQEILSAGYGIYSTICIIREHNTWIRDNENTSQQTFLSTSPKTATNHLLSIDIMADFFHQQFQINDTTDAMRYWQVYDRTLNTVVPDEHWKYVADTGMVEITARPWHEYTVSFLAWRIWEEISMYNHVTNDWNKEHLMQLNPYLPHVQHYLKSWLEHWCRQNPNTTVVRFTSLFYNFVWIWGAHERNRNRFTDWASYDFTVCPSALDDFAKEYGYNLSAEDFVRQGKYNATHRIPDSKKRDWMDFIGRFIRKATRELTDIVHKYNKLAYVFYDDSWVGLEPYNGHFSAFGFDGLIKCVFSGYEVRLCGDVDVPTHEIRFHPYLFPVGLGGAPTFSKGGQPDKDALNYWISTRRALLRKKIDRCGLGGYLNLTNEFPAFLSAMDTILTEFRTIHKLHDLAKPHYLKPRIGILTAWGKLRTWTLSGHFHETDKHPLIHVLECLSGLPFHVEFISFDDIYTCLDDLDVIINAGQMEDAWSGGILWEDSHIVETLTAWVYDGGTFIGIDEPSALKGYHKTFRMSHVLGVDLDLGEYACHGTWQFEEHNVSGLIPPEMRFQRKENIQIIHPDTQVLAADKEHPLLTCFRFGAGKGIYCAGFSFEANAPHFLQNLLLYGAIDSTTADGVTNNPYVETTLFVKANQLVFVNNSDISQSATCEWNGRVYAVDLQAYEMKIIEI